MWICGKRPIGVYLVMKIAIIIASRGLVFSKTMDSVLSNILENVQHKITFKLYMAHNLPIPQCFNEPLEQALADKPDLVWFVEEDMVIGKGALTEMLTMIYNGYKVVTGEYVDRRTNKNLTVKNEVGTVLFCGMGCLLVQASLFPLLTAPYIKRGCFKRIDTPNGSDYELVEGKNTDWYGTQDVYLTLKLRQLAGVIGVIKAPVGHLELLKTGDDLKNNGTHAIIEHTLANAVASPLVDTIGFYGHTKGMQVKVNHSGVCMGYNYTIGVPVNLPDEVITAIGRDNVEFLEVNEEFKAPQNTAMQKGQVKTK